MDASSIDKLPRPPLTRLSSSSSTSWKSSYTADENSLGAGCSDSSPPSIPALATFEEERERMSASVRTFLPPEEEAAGASPPPPRPPPPHPSPPMPEPRVENLGCGIGRPRVRRRRTSRGPPGAEVRNAPHPGGSSSTSAAVVVAGVSLIVFFDGEREDVTLSSVLRPSSDGLIKK